MPEDERHGAPSQLTMDADTLIIGVGHDVTFFRAWTASVHVPQGRPGSRKAGRSAHTYGPHSDLMLFVGDSPTSVPGTRYAHPLHGSSYRSKTLRGWSRATEVALTARVN